KQLWQIEPGPKCDRSLHRNRLQPPAATFGSGLSLAQRVRSDITEISGVDVTTRGLDYRELLLISCLTQGVHSRGVTDVSGSDMILLVDAQGLEPWSAD